MAWLIVFAVLLDAASTLLGLGLGLAERGLVAQKLLPVLGVAYFAVEYGILYGTYRVLEARARLPGHWAQLVAATGPWLAGWSNIGLVLRSAGVAAG